MKKLRKLSAEMIVALGATIVGVCALTVSIIETRIMQDEQEQQRIYQRASVWPNLTFQIDSDKDVHRLYLINNGVGLAMIESFDISVDKNPVEN